MSKKEPEQSLPKVLDTDKCTGAKIEKAYHILERVDEDLNVEPRRGITTDEEVYRQLLSDFRSNTTTAKLSLGLLVKYVRCNSL